VTDARFPERFLTDRRVLRLSAVDFRSYVTSLTWSVANRTDGVILPEDLDLIPHFAPGSPSGLVEQSLWVEADSGWTIADWDATQTSKHELEVLENARRREREKKKRQRSTPTFPKGTVPGDVPGDVSLGKAQDRTGKDRQGVEGSEVAAEDDTTWAEEARDYTAVQIDALASWAASAPAATASSSRCRVPGCGNKLASETGLATGLCRKGDALHEAARERMTFEEPF
jgi:hypothetical protein